MRPYSPSLEIRKLVQCRSLWLLIPTIFVACELLGIISWRIAGSTSFAISFSRSAMTSTLPSRAVCQGSRKNACRQQSLCDELTRVCVNWSLYHAGPPEAPISRLVISPTRSVPFIDNCKRSSSAEPSLRFAMEARRLACLLCSPVVSSCCSASSRSY